MTELVAGVVYTSLVVRIADLGRAPRSLGGVRVLLGALLGLCPALAEAAPLGAEPAAKSADSPEDVELEDEGISRLIRVARVDVRGREHVSARQISAVLRREGLIQGAEVVWPDDPRVRRARDRLRGTGYFKRVTLSLEPLPDSQSAAVLVVDVEERSSISVDRLYLGNSALTPFRGGVSVAERNFAGRGVLLGGSLIWGSLPNVERGRRQQAYRVFAEAPELGKSGVGVLGGAFIISAAEPYRVAGAADDPEPDHFRAFDYTRAGGVFGVTFPVLPQLKLGVDYRFERVEATLPNEPGWLRPDGGVVPVELGVRDGTHRLTVATLALEYDGRSQSFLTGKGARLGIDVQVSTPALGSQYEFIKLVAVGSYTLRLPWRHWLTPRAQAGQIAGDAPRFEQFYSGDLSAWTPGREQGLRYSTRNPIDVFGTGIDTREFGVAFARFDLEYVWPVFRRTRTRGIYGGDLFWSAGVFTLVDDRATRQRRRDQGQRVAPTGFNADFGLRLDTALGTVKLTVGNVLRRTPL